MVSAISANENNTSFWEKAAGVGAGYATYVEAKKYARKPYGKYITKQLENLPKSESIEFSKAAKKALVNNKLDKQGIKIVDITSANFEIIKDNTIYQINEKIKKRFLKVFMPKNKTGKKTDYEKNLEEVLKKVMKKNSKQDKKLADTLKIISEGKNACYIPTIKKVFVNPNKMGFSTFHELGHAINHTSKGFKGFLNKSRNFAALLAPLILLTSIIKKKKAPDEQPQSGWDKFTTFIKNNCGKLMFLAMVPTIAEEGFASINASKIAKDVLKPDMLKKMNNLNAKAWGSYVFGALAMSVCGALAVWVKDRVAQPELAVKKTI